MSQIKDLDELALSIDITSRLATLAFAAVFKDRKVVLDAIEMGLKKEHKDMAIFEDYKRAIQMYWDGMDG